MVVIMKAWTRWQDWTIGILGVILFLTPWLFGTVTMASSSWNAWIIGVVVVLLALGSLSLPGSSGIMEWITLIVGAWLFIAPWVLGFAILGSAAWAAWIIGILLVVASSWVLLEMRGPQLGATA